MATLRSPGCRFPCWALWLALAACAVPKQSWQDIAVQEVLVDVLPTGAGLEMDGRPLGPGPRTVRIPEADRLVRLRAEAPGFEPLEVAVEGRKMAGAGLSLILRPVGFGTGRKLDAGDGESMASAASLLLRAGKVQQAAEYAERAVEVSPQNPRARRALGLAHQRLGHRDRAIQELSQYLQLAPHSPDRAEVERQIEEARGDLTIPAPR